MLIEPCICAQLLPLAGRDGLVPLRYLRVDHRRHTILVGSEQQCTGTHWFTDHRRSDHGRGGLDLKYLKSGGPGCYYPSDRPSSRSSNLSLGDSVGISLGHCVHFFGRHLLGYFPLATALSSNECPVVFGTAGGVARIVGTLGLMWLKLKSASVPAGKAASGMDYMVLLILCLTSLWGILTLVCRATSGMGSILMVHLGSVATLIIAAPYGTFVHLVYRFLAPVEYRLD